MSPESRMLAYCLHGASQLDADLYLMINGSSQLQRFGIHEGTIGQWRRVIDTSRPSPDDFLETDGHFVDSAFYRVASRSVVVLVRE